MTPHRQRASRANGTRPAATTTTAEPARVVIADDHELARLGLRHMLDDDTETTVVGEADSGEALIDLVARVAPDMALVDVRMPGIGGLEATRRITATTSTRVVVVSVCDDGDVLMEALRAGAVGYVLKDIGRAGLLAVLKRALAGECTIEPSLATVLLQRMAAGTTDRTRQPEPLTPRETEILRLVAQGRTNREIAGRLIVAVGTVKIHIEHILGKLGVGDRTEAAVRGVELGLVRIEDGEPDGRLAPRA